LTQGDINSDKAILRMRKELDYAQVKNEIIEHLNDTNHLVLATSSNDRVTARTVDFANDGLTLFFMTWEYNKKVRQIKENPQVAMCINEIQIEGKAEILGKPTKGSNAAYIDILRKKFSDLFIDTFTNIPTIVLVRIIPTKIVRFCKIENRFHFQKLDIANEKAFQMRLEDKSHPAFPD